jgi:subtilisin family serine protease
MPLQILGPSGVGALGDATAALNYAVAHGAQITLDAWVPYVMTPAWTDAVAAAAAQGNLIITAAGNNSGLALDNLAQMHLGNVVIVGAVDSSNQWASFSNSGANVVDMAAPGVEVIGLVTDGRYQAHSGTSVSAAQVAGTAAQVWGLHPTLSAGDIVKALYAGADRVLGLALAGDVADGRVLDLAGTLAAAAQLDTTAIVPGGAAAQVAGPSLVPATPVRESLPVPVTPDAAFALGDASAALPSPLAAFVQLASSGPSLQTPLSATTAVPPTGTAPQVATTLLGSPRVNQGSNWLASPYANDPASEHGQWDMLASMTDDIASEKE